MSAGRHPVYTPLGFKHKFHVTEREVEKHLAVRQQRAEQIICKAQEFKFCDQCLSISYKSAGACSVCGAYRFIEEPAAVREVAKAMGAKPFPATSGTVPRI